MDKISKFGKEVGMRGLPPGFRFEPTEEELVFEYLKCKVLCRALPASIIPEINNVCNYDPWDAPGGEEERYLFSKKLVGKSSNISNTPTPSGYWKAKGRERKIVSSNSNNNNNNNDNDNNNVGMKKTLAFYTNTSKGGRTGWMMHEYRLISTDQPPQSSSHQTLFDNDNDNNNNKYYWVLCRIFFKKHHPHRQKQSHYFYYYNSIHSDSVSSTASSSPSTSTSSTTEFTSSTPLQQNHHHHHHFSTSH